MLTEFGKELKKIRIDNDQVLKDMANSLGITASYLSAIEHGKREIPTDMINKLVKQYVLDSNTIKKLESAASNTQRVFKCNFNIENTNQLNVVNAFAREYKSLTNDKMKRILKILDE